jgi:hypothetical protein
LEALSTTGRKDYLGLWQQNVDVIFYENNLNKLEAAFGKSYKEAIKNSLQRMKSGMNRTGGMTVVGTLSILLKLQWNIYRIYMVIWVKIGYWHLHRIIQERGASQEPSKKIKINHSHGISGT